MTDPRPSADASAVADELRRLAEIAAGILDGEEVRHIITDQAMHHVANPDPDHRFLAGDYYDVDHELFLRTKKLLLRIARMGRLGPLGGVEPGSSVWVPVPATDLVTTAVHNGVHHRYYTFGQLAMAAPAEMKRVLQRGEIVVLGPAEDGGQPVALVTALGPVRDSLGDVVGVVELTAPAPAAADGQGPAWS